MNGSFTNLVGVGVVLGLLLLGTSAGVNAQEVTDSRLPVGHATSWLDTNSIYSGHPYGVFKHLECPDGYQFPAAWIFSLGSVPDSQNTLIWIWRDGNSVHENAALGDNTQFGRRVWTYEYVPPEVFGYYHADLFAGTHLGPADYSERVWLQSGEGYLHTVHARSPAPGSSAINPIDSGWRSLGDLDRILMGSNPQRSEDPCKKCKCCGRRDKPLGNLPLAAAARNDLNLTSW